MKMQRWLITTPDLEVIEVWVRTEIPMPQSRPDHWSDDARCGGMSEPADILAACKGCPVRKPCLEQGRRDRGDGPYGGYILLDGRIAAVQEL